MPRPSCAGPYGGRPTVPAPPMSPGCRGGQHPMPTTIQPIILTTDAERLAAFYAGLLGATETRRVPADGPVFFIGLTVDDAEVGIVADASVDTTTAPRVLISID